MRPGDKELTGRARRREQARAWQAGVALLTLVLAGRPDAVPAQALASPVEHTVELADEPWTDSGIDVASGDRLVLKAEGRFGFANGIAGGPEGVEDMAVEGLPLPSAPLGAVIGRIGDALFAVGAGVERVVEAGGRLHLGANIPPTHSQQFPLYLRVAVAVVPPPLPSPPAPPPPDPDERPGSGDKIDVPSKASVASVPAKKASPAPATPSTEQLKTGPWVSWPLLLGALAAAMAVGALGLSKWRRARLTHRTKGRLAVAHSLSAEPSVGGHPPPQLKPAWPAVATRWRMEEKEPAFGGWAGEEARDG